MLLKGLALKAISVISFSSTLPIDKHSLIALRGKPE